MRLARPALLSQFCALAVVASACTVHDPLYCDVSHPCDHDPTRTYCDLEGIYPQAEGHGHTCIASPFDAGVPDGDAALADTGVPELDAMVVDASADGGPTDPPVNDGQAADLVLGQPDFVSSTLNNGGQSGSFLAGPLNVSSDGSFVWTGEFINKRVLQWNSLPISNMQSANVVIGQSSMDASSQAGPSQNTVGAHDMVMPLPHEVYVFGDGAKVYVSDTDNNRVLIWNSIPAINGSSASVVLGQTTYATGLAGSGASQLSGPAGLWSDGTHLILADTSNNRVLIWNSVPTTNADTADVVIGQPDFLISSPAPPGDATLKAPLDVFFDGVHLFVADSGNNRIMVWTGIPTTNGQPASYVIGQSAFDNGDPNASGAGTSAVGLYAPAGVHAAMGSLFVSDTGNNRVVVYTPVPTTNGAGASAVLGQDNLGIGTIPAAPAANRLAAPWGIGVAGSKLFVADRGFNRVLRYDLAP